MFQEVTGLKNFLFLKSGCSVEVLLRKIKYSEKADATRNWLFGEGAPQKKQLLWRNCCFKNVLLVSKCEEVALPKTKLSWKSLNMPEGNRPRKRPSKKSVGHVCLILSSKISAVVCITNKKLSWLLLLADNIPSLRFVFSFDLI